MATRAPDGETDAGPEARNLADGFLRHADARPEATALWVDGGVMTYGEARDRVAALITAFETVSLEPDARVAVLADRSALSYLAALAAVASGRAFVPVNPRHPSTRNGEAMARAGCTALVVEDGANPAAEAILDAAESPIEVIRAGGSTSTAPIEASRTIPAAERVAYILFTSGSTGTPKGVAVSHANVVSYVDTITGLYEPTPADKFSQVFDQTFDLSIHDIFVALSCGAALHVVPAREQQSPGRFLREHALTFWFSTPSTAAMMQRLGAMKPDAFPSLRVSLFCGEALPANLATAWAEAAPNSRVENLYGPTEATIAITRFPVSGEAALSGVVPIGRPFDGQGAGLLDTSGNLLPPADGAEGELVLTGDQLSLGYWGDADLSEDRFPAWVPRDADGRRWYRTGDLARYTDGDGYQFLGRLDDQVKVRGHRVELAEIEVALRSAAGTALAAAVAWPVTEMGAEGVVAFLAGAEADEGEIRERCAALLPVYMVPRRVVHLEELPLNTNGKVDRRALVEILRTEDG